MDNEEVSDETVMESVNRIKRLYMSKGYYYSQVAAGIEAKEDVIKVETRSVDIMKFPYIHFALLFLIYYILAYPNIRYFTSKRYFRNVKYICSNKGLDKSSPLISSL